ncbi:MAG: hypothetical protein M3O50_20855 [Myxococcota bacterium]|nr:hypothetical protein [Myxococcota bacterium]
MMTKRVRADLQTRHAIEACDLAAAFNEALKKLTLAPGDYVVELTAPVGPSTAGGVQAMQHLRLVPGRAGHPTLVAGHANHAEAKAELRTYEHLDAVHRQRFKKALLLDRAQYNDFFNLAKQVFTMMRLEVAVVDANASLDTVDHAGRGHRSWVAVAGIVAALLALLLAAGAIAWMIRRHL